MKIELPITLSYEFVLDEQRLREICDALLKQMELVTNKNTIITTFKIKSQDLKYGYEATSEKSLLDEVLSEDNGDEWVIQEIEIKIYNLRDDWAEVSISFSKVGDMRILKPISILSDSVAYSTFVILTAKVFPSIRAGI